ncbi:MAG: hypothetical protein HY578_00855, partial [Nitrospinae bacterium]|nr:hypothetical protein [Nitrospinota bacterium]
MENRNFSQNIKNLFVIPDIDNGTVKTSFLPIGKTPNVINYTISDGGKVILEGKGRTEVDAGGIVTFVIKMGNFQLWELDNPVLYLLEANAEEVIIKQYLGMRKIHADNKAIYFNNRLFYMRGYIRGIKAHDHPNLTGLSLEEYYLKNILQAKKFGFNFVRWHSAVPPEEFFCIADKAGVLCQIEIGYKGDVMDKDRNRCEFDKVSIDKNKWTSTILRFRNHPSLMVYCIGNEMHKSGTRNSVMEIYQKGKELDPTRLILDNCGWGEYDRKTSDFFCQHIAYFFPWNRHEDMFNEKWCFKINGSVKKHEMEQKIESDAFSVSLTREPVPVRPVVAHEVGHYISLHDLKRLETKFKKNNLEFPWWIGELKDLIKKKGMDKEYPLMIQASAHFQKICYKWLLERIRLSNYLVGFRFLQLSDTSYYENSNGILDCFDDEKWWTSEEFLQINSDTVLLTSLTNRVFTNGEMIEVPIFLSHYGKEPSLSGNLHCFINNINSHFIHSTVLEDISINAQGLHKLGVLSLKFNSCASPVKYRICVEFRVQNITIKNSWDIWLFPNSKGGFKREIPSHLENQELYHNYDFLIEKSGGPDYTDEVYVTDKLTSSMIDYLGKGGRVLLLYRHPDVLPGNRDTQFLFPSTLDHFKPVIWDRGHNLGGIVRKHPLTDT